MGFMRLISLNTNKLTKRRINFEIAWEVTKCCKRWQLIASIRTSVLQTDFNWIEYVSFDDCWARDCTGTCITEVQLGKLLTAWQMHLISSFKSSRMNYVVGEVNVHVCEPLSCVWHRQPGHWTVPTNRS